MFCYQFGNGSAHLCAVGNPVVQAVGMDADAFLFFVGYGVEETYALNETTVAAGLFVGCNDVEERTFFRAAGLNG